MESASDAICTFYKRICLFALAVVYNHKGIAGLKFVATNRSRIPVIHDLSTICKT
jgi:hypothetical protein